MHPKQIEFEGTPLLQPEPYSDGIEILDRDWVKDAFMVPDLDVGDLVDVRNRYYSSAAAKFTDTRLGCSIGINPRPQWTRYADIRVKGRIKERQDVSITNVSGNYGLGSAYSEGIDDPAQKIFMRFGVPQFNSLTSFLLNAFDREQTIMARTGRAPTAWYTLAKTVGTAITAISFPALTLGVMAGKAAAWLFSRPTSKFFTMKPTMFMYWSTVNHLVMNHCVNTGIIKRVLADEQGQRLGRPYVIDEESVSAITALFPDVFRNGTFDILAMATKAQRMANQQFMDDFAALGVDDATKFEGYLKRDLTGDGSHATYITDKNGDVTLAAYFNKLFTLGTYHLEKEENPVHEFNPQVLNNPVPNNGEGPPPTVVDPSIIDKLKAHAEDMKKYADAEMRDGAEWAVFRVEHTGSVSESFSNTTAESDLAQKLNSISNTMKEARFSLANGNIFDGVINEVQNVVTNIAMGAMDGITLGFAGLVAGLGGSGFIDIPKHWQSSNASLPRGSYKIRLISPYNNPISRLMDIWIPFYMILAAALPRSTGKSSYTHPFYCQIYDRGRLQSKLAMIESLSISRGTSNLQFDTMGQALAIDLDITVVDLSTIMHIPVSSGSLTETDITMDDDNITMDYLNVLAGMDIYSQIYPFPKAQLKATKLLANMKYKATSPAFHTAFFKNSITDGFINDISLGLSGLIYDGIGAGVKGNSLLTGNSG